MQNNQNQLSKQKKKKRIICFLVIVCLAVAAGYAILKTSGFLAFFESAENIKKIILDMGIWGRFIFVLIQFIQVTFIPLPALVTTVAGILVFGAWETFFLSIFAIMSGRLFAFWLGRKFGMPLIKWLVGKDDAKKWSDVLGQGKYTFFLMLLFPLFPDDILCLLAGTTSISWKFYTMSNIIAVIVTSFCLCFFASGQLIPFSGWGIPVWIILVIILAVMMIFSIKYREKIEQFIFKLGKKSDKINKKENEKGDPYEQSK